MNVIQVGTDHTECGVNVHHYVGCRTLNSEVILSPLRTSFTFTIIYWNANIKCDSVSNALKSPLNYIVSIIQIHVVIKLHHNVDGRPLIPKPLCHACRQVCTCSIIYSNDNIKSESGLKVSLKINNVLHMKNFKTKTKFEDTKGVIRIRITKKNRQQTQWPKEKVQKDKQRSTKHTYKTKDRVTRTPLYPGVN